MKTEKSKSELWYAIKELYQWRKGWAHELVKAKFDLLDLCYGDPQKFKVLEFIMSDRANAYKLWKQHPNEDMFFGLQHFEPED